MTAPILESSVSGAVTYAVTSRMSLNIHSIHKTLTGAKIARDELAEFERLPMIIPIPLTHTAREWFDLFGQNIRTQEVVPHEYL